MMLNILMREITYCVIKNGLHKVDWIKSGQWYFEIYDFVCWIYAY